MGRVAAGAKSGTIGKLAGLTVLCDDLQAETDSIALQNVFLMSSLVVRLLED